MNPPAPYAEVPIYKYKRRALVDLEDLHKVRHLRWRARPCPAHGYVPKTWVAFHKSSRNAPYYYVMMHHLIMPPPHPGWKVRHLNRNRLDNRKANLQLFSINAD